MLDPSSSVAQDASAADELICSIVERFVRRYARQCRSGGMDADDLYQELLCKAFQSLETFDASKSSLKTYVSKVVVCHARNLVRHHRAVKRDHRRTYSLTGRSPTGEAVDVANSLSADAHDRRLGRRTRSHEEQIAMRLDLEEFPKLLADDKCNLAERLKQRSLSELSDLEGIPRSTLQHRVRRLLVPFEEEGFREYL